jgi:uncharacterized protein (TIGR03437 family)
MRARLLLAAGAVAVHVLAAASLPIQGGAGFTENKGQWPAYIRYATEPGGQYLTSTALVLASSQAAIEFAGGNPDPAVSPLDPQSYVVNTYSDTAPVKVVTGARVFGRIQYTGVWPGIDAVFSQETFFTFRFVVRPGGDASSIRLAYTGTRVSLGVYSNAQLVLTFAWGRLGQNTLAYQETGGARTPVGVHYKSTTGGWGIALDEYDRERPVIIESTLPIGSPTFVRPQASGPSGALYGFAPFGALLTAVPAVENVCTNSGRAFPCADAAVASYGPDGRLRYLTRIQGSHDDVPTTLAVDARENVYVAGRTNSSDLPGAAGTPKTAFLAKIDGPTGCLLWTVYAGRNEDTPNPAVKLDGSGNAYIATRDSLAKYAPDGRLVYETRLPADPTTFAANANGNAYLGGDAAVTKLNPAGGVVYSFPYPGGVSSIAVDSQGNAWFLTRFDGVMTTWIDYRSQARLVKLDANGSKVLYETPFIGGEIAVDGQDRPVVLTNYYPAQVVRTAKGLVTNACSTWNVTLLDRDGTVLANRPLVERYYTGLAPNGRLVRAIDYSYSEDTVEAAAGPEPGCTLNSASLTAPNEIAPGELFTIVGAGIGAGARVLLNGEPVSLLYAGDGQINAIAPFSLPLGEAAVEVEYQGRRSPALPLRVVPSQPELFTLDGSGAGNVLAVNQDGTFNSPANPAKLGSIVTLFATGTATTATPIEFPGYPSAVPVEILYWGPSPGALPNITQINLRLPPSVQSDYPRPLDARPILFTGSPIRQFATIALKK